MKTLLILVFSILILDSISGQSTEWAFYLPNQKVYDIQIDSKGIKYIATWSDIHVINGSKWTYLRKGDGSSFRNTNCIRFDQNGNTWVGTYLNGLYKNDGIQWKNYLINNSSIKDNSIISLHIDPLGICWMGFLNTFGVSSFDGSNWKSYNPNAGRSVNSIISDANRNMYFSSSDKGLVDINQKPYTSILQGVSVTDLEIDKSHNLWVGTNSNGLYKYDGTSWKNFNTTNSWLPSNSINCIAFESNIVWVGTSDGLAKYDGFNWTAYTIYNSQLPNRIITALAVDSDNNILIGTDGSGFAIYKKGGIVNIDNFEKIPTKYSLSQNYPNPFNPTTEINYSIPSNESLTNVTLKIYDLLGTEITTLVNEIKSPGYYSIVFDGSRITSGIYYYQINAGYFTQTKKLVLLK